MLESIHSPTIKLEKMDDLYLKELQRMTWVLILQGGSLYHKVLRQFEDFRFSIYIHFISHQKYHSASTHNLHHLFYCQTISHIIFIKSFRIPEHQFGSTFIPSSLYSPAKNYPHSTSTIKIKMLFNLSSVVVLTLAAISVASPVSNPDKKAKVAKSVTCKPYIFLKIIKGVQHLEPRFNSGFNHR